MKKFLVFALAIAMLTLPLAGCGGAAPAAPASSEATSKAAEPAPASSEPASPAAADGKAAEIEIWHYFNNVNGEEMTKFVKQFNDTHPNIHITETFVARNDLLKQYTMGAVSGDLPDIGMVDNPDHASFSAMGVFEDITDLVDKWGQKDQFFEGPMKSCIYEDKIYGLPNNSNALALFYNKDILEKAGVAVPKTWDELEAAAAKLTHDDVYGLSISAVKTEEGTFQFMPWFLSANGTIEDLGGAGPIKAVTYLNNLIQKGYMAKDVINWTQSDANQQFMNGKAAMQVNGPWNIQNIAKNAPDLNYGVALIPKDAKDASVLGGENFAMCVDPTDRDAAFEFLTWFMGTEVNAEWCVATGKFPPRSDSIKLKDIWTTDPIYSVFGEALQYAMPRGPHPRWPEISEAMSTAFHEVYTGANTPEAAMKSAAEKYTAIMAEK